MPERRWRTLCDDGRVHAEFSIATADSIRRRCREVVSTDDGMGCGPHRVEYSDDGAVWRPEITGTEGDHARDTPRPRCDAEVLVKDDRFGAIRYQCELDADHLYEQHAVVFTGCEPVAALRWHGSCD